MAFDHIQRNVASILILTAMFFIQTVQAADDMSNKLLPGPENYKPASGSVILEDSVALQWQLFEGANLFWVQAAYSKNFSDLFLDDTSIYHFYILYDLPQDGTRIFWRVRACNLTEGDDESLPENLECISEWSKAYSFYSGQPADNGEQPEETNFFRRVLGCGQSDGILDLLPSLIDLLPLGISILVISKLHTPRGKI